MEQVLEGIEMGAALLFFLFAVMFGNYLMHECDSMYLRMEQVEKESVIQKEDGAVLQGWLENE